MADKTSVYGLTKPLKSDYYDVGVFNENADIIDETLDDIQNNGGVGTSGLANSSVTNAKIASGAVTSAKLGTSAVTTDKIASKAVTTAKLADGAVTADKLAADVTDKMEATARQYGLVVSEDEPDGAVGNWGQIE